MARSSRYKDFLQAALQRRFIQTMGFLLVGCYLQALVLGNWPPLSFWWFLWWASPFGPVGIRTVFLFFGGLAILVCRFANYHVGVWSAKSPFKSLRVHFLNWQTLWALFYYTLSAMVFVVVYVLSAPERAGLQLITHMPSKRAILNERPVFFVCLVLGQAFWHTFVHRFWDQDRLDMDRLLPHAQNASDAPQDVAKWLSGLVEARARQWLPESVVVALNRSNRVFVSLLPKDLPELLISASVKGVIGVGIMMPVYLLLLRGTARAWSLALLRPWFNLPRSGVTPAGSSLPMAFLVRAAYVSGHLIFMWLTANRAFTHFMVKQPVKNDKPLTSDAKDANGTLLSGLRSNKLSQKAGICFAMWELRYIADSPVVGGVSEKESTQRRRAIYDDIDRKDGPMWLQVFAICNNIIRSTEPRIDEALKQPEAPLEAKENALIRVEAPPLSQPVASAQTPRDILKNELGIAISNFARSPGQTPASRYAPYVRKAFSSLEEKTVGEGKVAATYDQVSKMPVLRIALGSGRNTLIPESWPLHSATQAAQHRFTGIILGEPYAEKTLYMNAAHVLGQLAVHSLREDQFGNVHRDVPTMVRTLTTVITRIEQLRATFVASGSGPMATPEVDEVVAAYRAALRLIIDRFEKYKRDLKLTDLDIKAANDAAREPRPEPAPEAPKQPDPLPANETKGRVHERASERVDRRQERHKEKDEERRKSRRPEMEEAKQSKPAIEARSAGPQEAVEEPRRRSSGTRR